MSDLSLTLNERRRIELMNDCHLTFDQANTVMKKIKKWKLVKSSNGEERNE